MAKVPRCVCSGTAELANRLLATKHSINPLLNSKVPQEGQGLADTALEAACCLTLTTSRGVIASDVTSDPIDPATNRGSNEGYFCCGGED
jgi:hypothetical protein